MIEVYAFLAVFTIQVLVMSVVQPFLFIRVVRATAKGFPAERFAQLYPGVDHTSVMERYLNRFRVAN